MDGKGCTLQTRTQQTVLTDGRNPYVSVYTTQSRPDSVWRHSRSNAPSRNNNPTQTRVEAEEPEQPKQSKDQQAGGAMLPAPSHTPVCIPPGQRGSAARPGHRGPAKHGARPPARRQSRAGHALRPPTHEPRSFRTASFQDSLSADARHAQEAAP